MGYMDDADYQAVLRQNRCQRRAFAAGKADRAAGREFQPEGFDYTFYRLGYYGPRADPEVATGSAEMPY